MSWYRRVEEPKTKEYREQESLESRDDSSWGLNWRQRKAEDAEQFWAEQEVCDRGDEAPLVAVGEAGDIICS